MSNFNLNQLANAVLASDVYQGARSTSRVQHILEVAFLKLGLVALAGKGDLSIQLDNGFRVVCKVEEKASLTPALKGQIEAEFKRQTEQAANDGWMWMMNPTRNNGEPIPVRVFVVDGVSMYQPFEDEAVDFEWAERSDDWQVCPAPCTRGGQ